MFKTLRTARGSRNLQYNLDEYEFYNYEYTGKYEKVWER